MYSIRRILQSSVYVSLALLLICNTVFIKQRVEASITKCDLKSILEDTTNYDSCEELIQCSTLDISGNDNIKIAFEYFTLKGLTPEQSAGIVGNLIQESNVNPFAEENPGTDSGGKGIAQWTGGRRIDFEDAAAAAGVLTRKADYDRLGSDQEKNDARLKALQFNLDYLWQEGTSRGDIDKLRTEGVDIASSVVSWEKWFERAGKPVLANRLAGANAAYNKYAASAPTTGEGGAAASAGCTGSALAQQVVEIALAEVGIKEGTPECNKYFEGSGITCSTAWCAAFTRWVFKRAGAEVGGGNRAKGVGEWFEKNKFFFRWNEQYRPQPGDIFVKGREGSGTTWTGSGHIGIVVAVNGYSIETVEGNSGNKVSKNTYSDYSLIPQLIGFGRFTDPGSVQKDPSYTPPGGGAIYEDTSENEE